MRPATRWRSTCPPMRAFLVCWFFSHFHGYGDEDLEVFFWVAAAERYALFSEDEVWRRGPGGELLGHGGRALRAHQRVRVRRREPGEVLLGGGGRALRKQALISEGSRSSRGSNGDKAEEAPYLLRLDLAGSRLEPSGSPACIPVAGPAMREGPGSGGLAGAARTEDLGWAVVKKSPPPSNKLPAKELRSWLSQPRS